MKYNKNIAFLVIVIRCILKNPAVVEVWLGGRTEDF
jgi:hypothetical protein